MTPRVDIRPIPDGPGWDAAYRLMSQLRTHLTFDQFAQRCREAAAADGYTLYGAFDGETLVGLMGIRTLTDLLHGRHLYIDDLVVDVARRSGGVGRELLLFAEQLARDAGGVGLRLCTGIDHEAGKRFYVREGWEARAVAFKKGF